MTYRETQFCESSGLGWLRSSDGAYHNETVTIRQKDAVLERPLSKDVLSASSNHLALEAKGNKETGVP